MPTDVRPAKDSVLTVFAPVMVMAVADALVKLTLLKVKPPPAKVVLAAEQFIVDVPALNVKFAVGVKLNEVPPKESVELFKLTIRMLVLLLAKSPPDVIE